MHKQASFFLTLTLATLLATFISTPSAFAQAEEAAEERQGQTNVYEEIQARRQFERARDLLEAGETDRGTSMLENIIEQFPQSELRYQAYLSLGRHLVEARQENQAIAYLKNLRELDRAGEELTGDRLDWYLESLYLTGIGYFQMREYNQSFAALRRITVNHPNSVWANQSYYYIGMCHFALGNWAKAIENLNLVGTFVDPDSPTMEYVEAGRRLYVRVQDGDLPVQYRLGRTSQVQVEAESGDKARISLIMLSENDGIFIGSIPTEMGTPFDEATHNQRVDPNRDKPDQRRPLTLQVRGGDRINISYVDENTLEGERGVKRLGTVRVVSTASLNFTNRTFEDRVKSAFINQPLYVVLHDADHDRTPEADRVDVRFVSRYRVEEDMESAPTSILDIREARPEVQYEIRDELTITVSEIGETPVHTGRFGGEVDIQEFRDGMTVDRNDQVLMAAVGDEVVAIYSDELHIGGDSPREVTMVTPVAGEIDASPRSTQDVVNDPALRAKKFTVEGAAFLELSRIFYSMGLREGAMQRAAEGLTRVDDVIRISSPIPREQREDAFRLKWELHLVRREYNEAITTCRLFAQAFPDSPLVDEALLGIGKIQIEQNDYAAAIRTFNEILKLPDSLARPEAQYRIAEATERMSGIEAAIREYQTVSERFAGSPYAAEALRKMVKYHIDTRNISQANDLLQRIFEDYQDAEFLDEMLAYWYLVLYRMGDFQGALDKIRLLIYEYPSSPHAASAKSRLPVIEEAAKRAQGQNNNE